MSSEYEPQADFVDGDIQILASGTRRWAIVHCVLLITAGTSIGIGSGMQLLNDDGHHAIQHSKAMMAFPGSGVLLGLGLLLGLGAYRGYPKILVSARGVKLAGILRNRSALWENLGPFESSNRGQTVTAEIFPNSPEFIGPATRQGKLVLPAMGTDAGKLSVTLNAMRTRQSARDQSGLR